MGLRADLFSWDCGGWWHMAYSLFSPRIPRCTTGHRRNDHVYEVSRILQWCTFPDRKQGNDRTTEDKDRCIFHWPLPLKFRNISFMSCLDSCWSDSIIFSLFLMALFISWQVSTDLIFSACFSRLIIFARETPKWKNRPPTNPLSPAVISDSKSFMSHF